SLRDREVGVTLGEQGEHLALAWREPVEGIRASHQLPDDLGVDDGAASDHRAECLAELLDIDDAVLEQVADGPTAGGVQELVGIAALDVLAQRDDRQRTTDPEPAGGS